MAGADPPRLAPTSPQPLTAHPPPRSPMPPHPPSPQPVLLSSARPPVPTAAGAVAAIRWPPRHCFAAGADRGSLRDAQSVVKSSRLAGCVVVGFCCRRVGAGLGGADPPPCASPLPTMLQGLTYRRGEEPGGGRGPIPHHSPLLPATWLRGRLWSGGVAAGSEALIPCRPPLGHRRLYRVSCGDRGGCSWLWGAGPLPRIPLPPTRWSGWWKGDAQGPR